MEIIKTSFDGLFIIKPKVHTDERGYFLESFNQSVFEKAGLFFTPVQDNESRSARGVLRGLHYQLQPAAQAKLLRVVSGKILDVAVDIRPWSDTFGKWFSLELDGLEHVYLFIPRGFAHGFSVISPIAIIQYKCDNFYTPAQERGIRFDDPDLGIDWRLGNTLPIISERDLAHPSFADADNNFIP